MARHPVISLRIATYELAFYLSAVLLARLQSQLNVGAKVCCDDGLTGRHVCRLTSVETREARNKKKKRERIRERVSVEETRRRGELRASEPSERRKYECR